MEYGAPIEGLELNRCHHSLRVETCEECNRQELALARKLRAIFWEGNPPPEDESFKTWLMMAREVAKMIDTKRWSR